MYPSINSIIDITTDRIVNHLNTYSCLALSSAIAINFSILNIKPYDISTHDFINYRDIASDTNNYLSALYRKYLSSLGYSVKDIYNGILISVETRVETRVKILNGFKAYLINKYSININIPIDRGVIEEMKRHISSSPTGFNSNNSK